MQLKRYPMRGLIFNYLLEYLEEIADYSLVDRLIESSNLHNDGSFADGGLYDDTDLIRMFTHSSRLLNLESQTFLEQFGEWLFVPLFTKLNSIYTINTYRQSMLDNTFDLIVMLNTIHYKEVVKLYPDSQFPQFDVVTRTQNELEVYYRSDRKVPYLAKGLLMGCCRYFKETMNIQMCPSKSDSSVLFTLTKEI